MDAITAGYWAVGGLCGISMAAWTIYLGIRCCCAQDDVPAGYERVINQDDPTEQHGDV